ncbi:hypothetical protein F5Y07DRAFT_406849 [Xylaria sp. FL0933]|nr:hypothetical protein F5Y07DRAFT_406849 [Xylaria sp. FL0933]
MRNRTQHKCSYVTVSLVTMSVLLSDLLTQSPSHIPRLYYFPDASKPRTSQKAWASKYPEILPPALQFSYDPSIDEINKQLGPEDEMDRFLLSKVVHPLNQTEEALQSEGDSRRVFYTQIALPVQLGLQEIIELRSESGPPGSTSCPQTADFLWMRDDQSVIMGEFKRHGIIEPATWMGRKTADTNQRFLGKELRGYCEKYKTPAAALFDGQHLLLLVFKAEKLEAIKHEDCPVLGFMFPYSSATLRYCLFRVTSQQIRRCQTQKSEGNLELGGYTRHFEWWSGAPYWKDAANNIFPHHPSGRIARCFNPENGEWYWDIRPGRVIDTVTLW